VVGTEETGTSRQKRDLEPYSAPSYGLSDRDSGDAIRFARPRLEVVQSVGKKCVNCLSLPEFFF